MKHCGLWIVFSLTSLFLGISADPQCGEAVGGKLCPEGECCSTWGYCGTTYEYCEDYHCQSQCRPSIRLGRKRPSIRGPLVAKNITGHISKSLTKSQCGWDADVALCPNDECCSKWGYCGTTSDYCRAEFCQSGNCDEPDKEDDDYYYIKKLIPKSLFEKMLMHRNDEDCPAKGFYTYKAFIKAIYKFPHFAADYYVNTSRREIAAFLAQTSHQTQGGWPDFRDGANTWGYCVLERPADPRLHNYCVPNSKWPCVKGKSYHKRGPMMISYNDVYGKAGKCIWENLLKDPDLVTKDPFVSFETALWYWMTPQMPDQPSCHDVIIGDWRPSAADKADRRLPGYGMITNIINGKLECGHGWDKRSEDRIGFYKRYCDILGVDYGKNLDCEKQKAYSGSKSRLSLFQKI